MLAQRDDIDHARMIDKVFSRDLLCDMIMGSFDRKRNLVLDLAERKTMIIHANVVDRTEVY